MGRSFWHFACAALNAGAAGLVPGGTEKATPPPRGGSGKLGTPLARMQFANASAAEPLLDEDGPELVAALLVVDRALVVAAAATVDAGLVASPTVAAVGLCELPPHPATKAPLRSAVAASTRARWGMSLLI